MNRWPSELQRYPNLLVCLLFFCHFIFILLPRRKALEALNDKQLPRPSFGDAKILLSG